MCIQEISLFYVCNCMVLVTLQSSKAVVPLQLDSTGQVKYDVIAKLGQRKDKVVHTSLQAMVPRERPTDPELVKPDEEEVEKVEKSSKCSASNVSGSVSNTLGTDCWMCMSFLTQFGLKLASKF